MRLLSHDGVRWFFVVVFLMGASMEGLRAEAMGTADRESLRRRIVAGALASVGAPYRYGGSDLSGYDCSGLVMSLFRDVAGLQLPRSSKEQWDFCTPTTTWPPEAGDLVFFREKGKIFHVGISLGDGTFISAISEYPRAGVLRSMLSQPYWESRYAGAGRVLPDDGVLSGGASPGVRLPGGVVPGKPLDTSDVRLELRWSVHALSSVFAQFAGGGAGIGLELASRSFAVGGEARAEYDSILGVASVPLLLSFSFDPHIRFRAGLRLTQGSPAMDMAVDAALGEKTASLDAGARRIYEPVNGFAPMVELSWTVFEVAAGKRRVGVVADISGTAYRAMIGSGADLVADLRAAVRFGLGVNLR